MLGPALTGTALTMGGAPFAALRRAATPPNPSEPTTEIVTTGQYCFIRNPIYLSFTLMYAEVAVQVNAPRAALLLAAVLIMMRRGVIDREGQYLERRSGDECRR